MEQPSEAESNTPLELILFPKVYAAATAVGAGVALTGAGLWRLRFIPFLPVHGTAIGLMATGSALGVWSGKQVMARWGKLTLGETIVYQRGMTRVEYPLRAAWQVTIQRPKVRGLEPFTCALIVQANGLSFSLPFAESWLSLEDARAEAGKVAEKLRIPVFDPEGTP